MPPPDDPVPKDVAYHRVVLLIPKPFDKAWGSLAVLSQAISKIDSKPAVASRWPILALTIKAAQTTLSIATLAAMRQWPDGCILGRSLFETEMQVKWMLEKDTDARVTAYLGEITSETDRLMRKMTEGASTSAQMLRALVSAEAFRAGAPASTKDGQRQSVRDRAKATNLDRSYDMYYWVSSIFAHSHALSLSAFNPDMVTNDSPFTKMFNTDENGMAASLLLMGAPMSALDTFQLADHHFNLGMYERIEQVRGDFREAISDFSGGKVKFSAELERGDVKIQRSDGSTHTLRPKRSGHDPMDDIP